MAVRLDCRLAELQSPAAALRQCAGRRAEAGSVNGDHAPLFFFLGETSLFTWFVCVCVCVGDTVYVFGGEPSLFRWFVCVCFFVYSSRSQRGTEQVRAFRCVAIQLYTLCLVKSHVPVAPLYVNYQL